MQPRQLWNSLPSWFKDLGRQGFTPALGVRAIWGLSLLCLFAFTLVLIAAKFMTLAADEHHFLHEAYALAQGWLPETPGQSYPYDLYRWMLAVWIRPSQPSDLWIALGFDIGLQLSVMAVLVAAFVGLLGLRSAQNLVLAAAFVAFFFTVGRLAEHRPDYLAVTALSLGFLGGVIGFGGRAAGRAWIYLFAAGICFGLALCLSPRSLAFLAFASPVFLGYLCYTHKTWRLVRLLVSGLAGLLTALILVRLVTGFSILSALMLVFDAGSDTRKGLGLDVRLYSGARFFLFAFTLSVALAASRLLFAQPSPFVRLLTMAALSLALGQLVLIFYDDNIYGYGYSYGLAASLFLLAGLHHWRRQSPSAPQHEALHWRMQAAVLFVLVIQLPLIAASKGASYNREFTLQVPVSQASTEGEMIASSIRAWRCLAASRAGFCCARLSRTCCMSAFLPAPPFACALSISSCPKS